MELVEFQNRAGFSEGEVEFYFNTFSSYDRDGGGNLYPPLRSQCGTLGWH